jgi:hypothetical protein
LLLLLYECASKLTDAAETANLRFFDDEDFAALFAEDLGEDDATSTSGALFSGVDNKAFVPGEDAGDDKALLSGDATLLSGDATLLEAYSAISV